MPVWYGCAVPYRPAAVDGTVAVATVSTAAHAVVRQTTASAAMHLTMLATASHVTSDASLVTCDAVASSCTGYSYAVAVQMSLYWCLRTSTGSVAARPTQSGSQIGRSC